MNVVIAAERDGQPDETELQSLLTWLLEESPKPWRVALAPQEQAPGTMGSVFDTLQVALGAGGAGAVLAGALTAWIGTRPTGVRMRIRRPDGTELIVDGEFRDPDAVATALAKTSDEGSG